MDILYSVVVGNSQVLSSLYGFQLLWGTQSQRLSTKTASEIENNMKLGSETPALVGHSKLNPVNACL